MYRRSGRRFAAAFALARYLPNGALDATFGNGGRVTTPVETTIGLDSALALVALPDGRLVAGGSANDGTVRGLTLVRYKASGAVDRTFGADGHVFTPLPQGRAILHGLALGPGGKLIAVGAAPDGGATGFSVIR